MTIICSLSQQAWHCIYSESPPSTLIIFWLDYFQTSTVFAYPTENILLIGFFFKLPTFLSCQALCSSITSLQVTRSQAILQSTILPSSVIFSPYPHNPLCDITLLLHKPSPNIILLDPFWITLPQTRSPPPAAMPLHSPTRTHPPAHSLTFTHNHVPTLTHPDPPTRTSAHLSPQSFFYTQTP